MKQWVYGGRTIAATLALGALLSACSGNASPAASDSPSPSPTQSEDPDVPRVDFSHHFPARVRVEATGAANFVWEGEDKMQITRTGGPQYSVNLLSGGFLAPNILPEEPKNRFRWAFDFLSGYADEPGTFTLTGQPANQQGLSDGSLFIWMRVKDGSKEVVYEESELEFMKHFSVLRQPCTLVVGPDERSGSLHCPEVATQEGETVGYRVTWEAVGPSQEGS